MTEKEKEFLLLQINDALFPIGGYSHSYGLETYIQKDIVRCEDTAQDYISKSIRYNCCYTDLLAVRLAYLAASGGNLQEIEKLTMYLQAVKTPMEIRNASMKMGSRFLKTVKEFPFQLPEKIWERYCKYMEGNIIHHSIAYGVLCSAAKIPEKRMLETYLYGQVSAMVTNCVKTIPLSQTVGQRILFGLYPHMEETLEVVGKLSLEDLGRSTPGFDIRCMQHETLYSRLYMS